MQDSCALMCRPNRSANRRPPTKGKGPHRGVARGAMEETPSPIQVRSFLRPLVMYVAMAVALYFGKPFLIRAGGPRLPLAISLGALILGVALLVVAQMWSKRSAR